MKAKRNYAATYTKGFSEVVSEAVFEAENLKEAKRLANFHKRHNHDIKRHGNVRTYVQYIRKNNYENL